MDWDSAPPCLERRRQRRHRAGKFGLARTAGRAPPPEHERAGVAVGYAEQYLGGVSQGIRPVRWSATGIAAEPLSILGLAPGVTAGIAQDIDEDGFAVGYLDRYDASGTWIRQAAVCWHPDGSVLDLNDVIDPASGWVLQDARAISDSGLWIAGMGSFDPDGPGGIFPADRMFLVQVPEPAGTILLMMLAPAVLRRRR